MCTYKRCWKSIERTILSRSLIKQLHTLPVLHFNRCLTTEHSEATAHFNGNFDTEHQFYVLQPKCTATLRTHCIISDMFRTTKCSSSGSLYKQIYGILLCISAVYSLKGCVWYWISNRNSSLCGMGLYITYWRLFSIGLYFIFWLYYLIQSYILDNDFTMCRSISHILSSAFGGLEVYLVLTWPSRPGIFLIYRLYYVVKVYIFYAGPSGRAV
jgi:hypothetical protein